MGWRFLPEPATTDAWGAARIMKSLLVPCLLALLTAGTPSTGRVPQRGRAYDVGRATIGPTLVLDQIVGLRLEAERRTRSSLSSTPRVSRITIDFVMPEGYLETLAFSTPLIGQRFVSGDILTGFRKDTIIRRAEQPSSTRFRPMTEIEEASAVVRLHRRATELLASLLLTTRTPAPVEYAHIGRAKGGGRAAEVLEATCADGYRFQLFLDTETHRVVMMVPGPGGGSAPPSDPKQAQRWFFSDHRETAGLALPHVIVHEVEEETAFEWIVDRYWINPPVPPDLRRE